MISFELRIEGEIIGEYDYQKPIIYSTYNKNGYLLGKYELKGVSGKFKEYRSSYFGSIEVVKVVFEF